MAGGGAERQLTYLAEGLLRRGWEVHVALLGEGPNYQRLVATGVKIHKISANGNHDMGIIWQLVKLIRKIRPVLMQTWMTQMDVFGGVASRLTGTPFILSERSCASAYPLTLKHFLRIVSGRCAAAIIANSSEGGMYWRARTKKAASIQVVRNALPLSEIDQADFGAGDLSLPPNTDFLLFSGRLSPEKNIDTLIRAFKLVSKQRNAVLLLCGEGELKHRIAEIIREEGLGESVFLLGYVRNLFGLMKGADLLISISSFEGLPNVVIEAMACGCPLILSDIPAHRALLGEDEASFVDPSDVQGIAHAILTCMETPERSHRAALKAKLKASSYSEAAVAEQYEKIYHSVISI